MWFREKLNGTVIYCQIQPKASNTEIVGLHGTPPRLRIRIAAPPVDGKANEELVAFLSKKLKFSKNRIQILSGQSGKFKEVFISGIKADELTLFLLEKIKPS